MNKTWTETEFYLAMHLYYRIPFGKQHSRAPEIIQLANAIERTPSSVAMRLNNFTAYDPAEKARGIKGLDGGGKTCEQFWNAFHMDFDASSIKAELLWQKIVEKTSEVPETDEQHEVTIPEFKGDQETTRTVKIRLAQGYFRRVVLASYDGRCCVSDIPIPKLLIASHILPWASHSSDRIRPSNGLCLSRIHDAAFDQGLISFDNEYRLMIRPELKKHGDVKMIEDAFLRFEGKPLRMPEKNLPDPAALEWHRNKFLGEK